MVKPDQVLPVPSEMPKPTEATQAALADAGWFSACMLIEETARQIFGVAALVEAVPDPDGFFRKLAGKEGDKPGVFVTIASTRVPGLEASLVMPFDIEAISEIRIVLTEMALKLRSAEDNQAPATPQLLVPEKKLIIPGRD